MAEDLLLDFVLDDVGQLHAIAAKELDAVIHPGIVRRGDDDSRRELPRTRQVGHAGSGHDAGIHVLGSRRCKRRQPGSRRSRCWIRACPGRSAPGLVRRRRRRSKRAPSARPMAKTVRWSSGYSPATPRIPSVPNSCFMMARVPGDNYSTPALDGDLLRSRRSLARAGGC